MLLIVWITKQIPTVVRCHELKEGSSAEWIYWERNLKETLPWMRFQIWSRMKVLANVTFTVN